MIQKGKRVVNKDLTVGTTPCIRPISRNNGVDSYISLPPNHTGNTITVSYNGSVGEPFYQAEPFFALDDVNVLYPKFNMTPFVALFLIPLIRLERYRYDYGRKWNLHRMQESLIRLPVSLIGYSWSGTLSHYHFQPLSESRLLLEQPPDFRNNYHLWCKATIASSRGAR